MQTMQRVTHAAKGLAGLLAGWALGDALMVGAYFLGLFLRIATSDAADRTLLGGMLLAMTVLGVLLISGALVEMRRAPAWLLTFLLGVATAPALTIFGSWLFLWEVPTD